MKKAFFLILLAAVLNAAAQISFDPTRQDVRFSAEVGNGYYGDTEGEIRFSVTDRTVGAAGKDVTVYAWLDEPLSMEDMRFKDGVLEWQVYSPKKTDGLISAGYGDNWVPYYGRRVPVLTIDKMYPSSNVDVVLGTTLRWVPSVQPNGSYRTRIYFEIEEEI
jgi:hypothetical protein